MGYSVEWEYTDQTVIRTTMHDGWTWDDMLAGVQESYELIRQVTHPVDVIVMGAGIRLPSGDVFSRLRQKRVGKPANMGVLVFVTSSKFLEMVSGIFSKIYQGSATQTFFVSSLEAAHDLLAERHAAKS